MKTREPFHDDFAYHMLQILFWWKVLGIGKASVIAECLQLI